MGNADGAIFINEILGGTAPFTYEWSNGDSTQFVENLLAGLYSVTITDAAGCTFSEEFEVGVVVATDEVDNTGFDVSLYPNPTPASQQATLLIESVFVQDMDVRLFDVRGRILQKEQLVHPSGRMLFSLNAPTVAGVYIIEVKGENGVGVYLKWVVK